MRFPATTDRFLPSPRLRAAVGLGAIAAVAALTTVELIAPHDITLGAADIVPIVAAFAFADRRVAIAVLTLAIAGRGIDAAVDDIPVGLAALEVASFLLVYLLVAAAVDAAVSRRAASPEPTRRAATPAPAEFHPAAAARPRPLVAAADASLPTAMRLTAREREVATLAARGLTAPQIAARLSIGRRTVETHLARAYSKLGVRSKSELVARQLDGDGSLT